MVKLGQKIRFYTTLTTQIGCIKAYRKYLRYLVIHADRDHRLFTNRASQLPNGDFFNVTIYMYLYM